MATANEKYLDDVVRHYVLLQRYAAGLNKEIVGILEEADAELVAMLSKRLAAFGDRVDLTSKRWQALLEDIRSARAAAISQGGEVAESQLTELGKMEGAGEVGRILAALPLEIELTRVADAQLAAIVKKNPFNGYLLKDWFEHIADSDQKRVIQAIQQGVVQGESIDQIVRRVVGTRANKYSDGILAITRRGAQAVVRTAVSHIANEAREMVWEENADIVDYILWLSTLDGRTTPGCRSRDHKGAPLGNSKLPPNVKPLQPPTIRPPAHMGCRSTTVVVFNAIGIIGNRPYVIDTRTRGKREIDFRQQAKDTGRSVKEVREEWALKNIGTVPAGTTYGDWLKRQSADFQDEVLGKTRGRLFREGKLNIDQFVDREGNELTLKQLAKRYPGVFEGGGD